MKRKIFPLAAALAVTVLMIFGACGDGSKNHVHSFGDWTVDQESTCYEYGEKTRRCSCGEVETCAVDPTFEHEFDDGECIICGSAEPTTGLKYSLTADGSAYELASVPDSVTAGTVVVANVYEGKLVKGIAAGAFKKQSPQNNTVLKKAVLNEGIEYIGGGAFYNCTAMTEVELPFTLKTIGANAFYNCSELVSATIPDGVEKLSDGAFQKCTSLVSVTLPDGLNHIGASAFAGDMRLAKINLTGVIDTGASAFYGCSALTDVDLSALKRVRAYAFYGCRKIESVDISSVSAVDASAFENCTLLAEVTLPADISSDKIAPDAFKGTKYAQN